MPTTTETAAAPPESKDAALEKAIESAQTELAGGTPPTEAEETPSEEIAETPESGEETGEEAPESDLSEQELAESRNLYLALRGPQANAIIAALAAQAGLLAKPGEAAPTKTEIKESKKEIKDILAESLGKEYSFLADRLGPAIEAVLDQERKTSDSRFDSLQQANVEREVVASYNRLATETKGESKKFETRMAALAEEIPIGNQNVETYMKRLYTIASNERKSSPQKIADQIRRNASDAPQRLRSSAGPAGPVAEIPTKKMSIDESIRWAQDQLTKRK